MSSTAGPARTMRGEAAAALATLAPDDDIVQRAGGPEMRVLLRERLDYLQPFA